MIDPFGTFVIGFAVGVLTGAIGLLIAQEYVNTPEPDDELEKLEDLWGDYVRRPE